MERIIKINSMLLLLLIVIKAQAVNINHRGTGSMMLIPYYTVNNNLNTLVSITNPTNNSKALKINFREGLNGYSVLSYNVYLAAHDTWSFGLVPTVSSIPNQVGNPSVLHLTNDASCAPFLPQNGQEFLPFALVDGNASLQRATEGFIEVIEMGEVTGAAEAAIDPLDVGIPADCAGLEAFWEAGGQWNTASGGDTNTDMLPAGGGLMAEVNLIDVANGVNYSYPVLHLDGFLAPNTVAHVEPSDIELTLDAAEPVAKMNHQGRPLELVTNTGYDAVSALLMSNELQAEYAVDTVVNGQTDLIYSLPTRRFYFSPGSSFTDPPFNANLQEENCPINVYGGLPIDQSIFDRESLIEPPPQGGGGVRPPPPPPDVICGSVFVQSIQFLWSDNSVPQITHSANSRVIYVPTNAFTESGFIITRFEDTVPMLLTDALTGDTVALQGLPVIGLSLTEYTNAGARPGLLAQYGAAQQVKSTKSITVL